MTTSIPQTKVRGIFFRKAVDQLVRLFAVAALAAAVGGMGWIIWTLAANGIESISWSFLTEPSKPHGAEAPGIANALIGTVLITLGAIVIALPPALIGGIYLAEFGRNSRFAAIVRFSANVMMGMPSVIVGLFVYAVWVVPTGQFSGLAGSFALAIIMIPVVMRTTEDMLAMVPDALRESALALGLTRGRATLQIICKTARGGLVTGVLLSIARVSGETAPLLFTALWSDAWPRDFFREPTANLPVLITEYATNSPYAEQQSAGWGAALIITAAVLLLNIGCRMIFKEKKR